MNGIFDLFDLVFIKRIAKNIVPIIPPVTFIYLFIITDRSYLMILSIATLLFLTFYINYYERIFLIVGLKFPNYKKSKTQQKVIKIIDFVSKDEIFVGMFIASFLFCLTAFIVLMFNLINYITWILFFLCILGAFHYITALFSSIYVGLKYKKEIFKDKKTRKMLKLFN